jgi:hypothetical protein
MNSGMTGQRMRTYCIRRPELYVALMVLLFGSSGCSSGGAYPVSGQVVYEDGQPATELAGWTIVFDNSDLRVSSLGKIGRDGRFSLSFRKANDGAIPGSYKVTIYYPNQDIPDSEDAPAGQPTQRKRPRKPISSKYSDENLTPLTAIVEPKKNDITLTVARN